MAIGIKLAKELEKILADEVNVKKIVVDKKLKDGVRLNIVITPELRAEGVRRDIARMAQELRQKAESSRRIALRSSVLCRKKRQTHCAPRKKHLWRISARKDIFYSRSEKFDAEESGKWDGQDIWIGIKKI